MSEVRVTGADLQGTMIPFSVPQFPVTTLLQCTNLESEGKMGCLELVPVWAPYLRERIEILSMGLEM
jgi:hypothetical protein